MSTADLAAGKEKEKNDGDIDGDTGPMLPGRTSPGQEVGAQEATGKARVLEAFRHGGEKTAHNSSIRAEARGRGSNEGRMYRHNRVAGNFCFCHC